MIMNKAALVGFSMWSSILFADPVIFGMELGKTTESEIKSSYAASYQGMNKYSQGNMYSIPTSKIDFDGLQEVTTVFNQKGELIAVLTTLPKSKFDYIKNALDGKYKRVSQKIPFVGNKSVTYRDGSTEIELNAPHMSFEMSMNYIQDELMTSFNRQSKAEEEQKRSRDASQL